MIPKPGPGQRWRFAANLDWLYPEHAYLDRFQAAREDGFEAVELLRPYAFAVEDLQARLNGLHVALINAPAGDWDAGERGLAALPGREADFRAATAQGWQLAQQLGCPLLHVMSGIAEDAPETRRTWLANLRWAAEHAPAGLTLTIEPINRIGMPGYFLHRQGQAHELLDLLGTDRVRLQLDLYHCRVTEGESLSHLQHCLTRQRLAHVQLAGVAQRQEPLTNEFTPELTTLTLSNWAGAVGLEYLPAGDTSTGLAWLHPQEG